MWSPSPSDVSTEELRKAEAHEAALTAMRAERNARLAASDWVILRNLETNEPIPQVWLDYRQALRDMPLTPDQEWPNEPI